MFEGGVPGGAKACRAAQSACNLLSHSFFCACSASCGQREERLPVLVAALDAQGYGAIIVVKDGGDVPHKTLFEKLPLFPLWSIQ